MGAGRPTKYKEEYAQKAEDFLAEGYNRKALAAELDVYVTTVITWEKTYPEFREAIQRGLAKSERWFMNQVRSGFFTETVYDRTNKNTTSKAMNANVVALYARNVYNWDRKQTENSSNLNINLSYDPKKFSIDDEEKED